MKFTLGVMSHKWEIEAENIDIATSTIYLLTQSSAPVVCYSQEEQSKFSNMIGDIDKQKEFASFIEKNSDAILQAYKSIKRL